MIPTHPFRAFAFAAFLLATLAMPTAATAGPTDSSKNVTVTMLSPVQSLQLGETVLIGFEMEHAGKWHTYWRNPGDSGLATEIKWTLPEGVTAGEIQWPVPHRISTPPLMTYGYEGTVILLVPITVADTVPPGQPLRLAADLSWLECDDVCIPGSASVDLELPVSATEPQPSAAAERLASAQQKLPASSEDVAWTAGAEFSDTEIFLRLTPAVGTSPQLADLYFLANEGGVTKSAGEQTAVVMNGAVVLRVPRADNAEGPVERVAGVLTSEEGFRAENGRMAWQIDVAATPVKVAPEGGSTETPDSELENGDGAEARSRTESTEIEIADGIGAGLIRSYGVWGAIAVGLLGGLLLNLMPCVLPVLSIKVMSLVKHANSDNKLAGMLHGVAYAAGVVIFFALVGLILMAVGAGWGAQMQSPIFMAAITMLFVFLALNMLGVFEMGASLVGLDQQAAPREGYLKSFGTGALATIAATPCSGPFMGVALAFGISQSPTIALLIFVSLGLGMASPYLVLAAFPSLLRFVPKPGPWMESFKQFLGFLLLGAAALFLWMFAALTADDVTTLGLFLGALVVLALAAWIYGRWSLPIKPMTVRVSATVLALLLGGAAIGYGLYVSYEAEQRIYGDSGTASNDEPSSDEGDINTLSAGVWHKFTPERVAALRKAGRPVLIDFTAKWCLICQVNKVSTLRQSAVLEDLKAKGVVLLEADWTRRDKMVGDALAEYGRVSVPLYVLHLPGEDKPVILPEALTPGIVRGAIESL